ncbi:MAG: hypothetical protein Q7T93_04350 [Methylobacterium sp.]|uniref:hypothetical protein n=1 Tax=Methylobacterium sp. TaxID=409 RepID=UPI0027205E99|nr:hypothetical protein [Methylobacterium sp.]MDO9426041.1 hypothetical protein [Methylobacterium sp.]
MTTTDGDLEMSHYGGTVSRDGHTVKIYIYRFAGTADNWTVEIVDSAGHTTVWDGRFPDDLEAYNAFIRAVDAGGMSQFLEPTETLH